MADSNLAPVGLGLAAVMSVTNVLTDVARKHALDKRELIPATFWIRAAVTLVFGFALLWRLMSGAPSVIRDGGPLFGVASLHPSPIPEFLIYLTINVLLITIVMWLYFTAIQTSPLSMCVPFLSFTPVFLLFTGFLILGQIPPPIKALGVGLIVVGSLAMNRHLYALGWLAPAKAIVREKGSRYMLLVSLIFAITNPLEKVLVNMSDVFTEAFAYGLGLTIAFWVMGLARGGGFGVAQRNNWKWISLAGLFDGVSLLFQLASYAYIPVVFVVSIKRAGIVLSVFSGWLFFHERGITDKVIAASVMFCGVLILYLPLSAVQAIVFSVLTLIGMAAALYFTRHAETAS